MKAIIFEITGDETESGFVARALGNSIFTQAGTWSELRSKLCFAILMKQSFPHHFVSQHNGKR